ncbi:major egg antigen-like [Pecten maximus]|uniref:major egg antigen-like n=1 Tax=Pecten maximus TaxID=6579 RepID=UPI001458577A|nr:major egg antigen-like [Pecten maximus]
MALFRSELHVPVKRDDMTFQDRQVKSWEDMEVRMEKRRKEWDSEFESMKNEFFKLKPTEKSGSCNAVDTLDNLKTIFVNDLHGGQKFKVRFDVSEFRPEEIQVRVQDNKIAVSAKHEEKSTSSSVSKEYSRQVDIPSNVDQDKLQCILSKDGILSIEGPVRGQILGKETVLPIQHAVSTGSPTTNGTNGMSCTPSPNNQIAIARPLEVSTNTVKNPIITEPDGTRKLRLSVDVGEFKPEEIVVKTDKKKLIVHAEHEEKLTGRTMHKEFNKEYELPDSVDQTAISAYIGEEGKLYIEAPLKQVAQKRYSITQSHDVRKVVVTKESQVTVTDNQNRPLVTINVHRR